VVFKRASTQGSHFSDFSDETQNPKAEGRKKAEVRNPKPDDRRNSEIRNPKQRTPTRPASGCGTLHSCGPAK
jgi:hypothetical protein